MMVLNASVGPMEVLVASNVGIILGTSEVKTITVVGSGAEKIDTLELTSK